MSCHSRWIHCFGFVLLTSSIQAQPARFSQKEIGQIIDAALHAVVPPTKPLTSGTVAERGIRFDFGRTMSAFGYEDKPAARAGLGLTGAVTEGSVALLDDCDQMGSKTCLRLGRSAYVYLEPISVSDSEAVVWVHVAWATTPSRSKRTFLSSSSTEVILRRSGSGSWTFVRTGRSVIS